MNTTFATSEIARRKVTILLAVSIAFALCLLMWVRVLPKPTSDSILCKQPAIEFLATGRFSVPAANGFVVYADSTYGMYTPLYTYLLTAVFACFGVSQASSLAMDLALQAFYGISLLGLAWTIKRDNSSVPLILVAILSVGLMEPIGRTDTLGALLGTIATIFTARNGRITFAALVALTLAFSASLHQGLFAGVFLMLLELRQSVVGQSRNLSLGRTVLSLVFVIVGTIALWLPAMNWDWRAGSAQFLDHYRSRAHLSIQSIARTDPIWCICVICGIALQAVLFAGNRKSRMSQMRVPDASESSMNGNTHEGPPSSGAASFSRTGAGVNDSCVEFLGTSVLYSALALGLLVLLQQPTYTFRFAEGLMLVSVSVCLPRLEKRSHTWSGKRAFGVYLLFGTAFVPRLILELVLIVLPLFAPVAMWSFERARSEALERIPAGASVGGDGEFLLLLPGEAKSYYSIRYSKSGAVLPDFLLLGRRRKGDEGRIGQVLSEYTVVSPGSELVTSEEEGIMKSALSYYLRKGDWGVMILARRR